MPVQLCAHDNIPLLAINAEIDVYNAEKVFDAVHALIGASDAFILSLLNCRYCDSSGITQIIKLAGKKRFVIVATGQVRRVLDMVNLDKLFPVVSTVEEAQERLRA